MRRQFIAALAAALMVLSAIPALAASAGDAAYFVAGASGAPVKQLQIRLAQLGFFADAVDGTYGQKTELAIVDFKDYLQQVKAYEAQNVNAAQAVTVAPDATSAPVTTPQPTEEPDADVLASQATLDDATLAMIYDDSLDLYMGDITQASIGADVLRVQRRLKVLNYLNDKADGAMGANSIAALRKFQRLNNLPVTGEVDAPTREILYTTGVVASDKPVYNQLYQGMTGDEVRALQDRLWQLGFMYSSVDGSYGNSTQTAVGNLQRYLHSLEVSSTGFTTLGADTFKPSGIADPDLLEMILDGEFTIYRSDVKVGMQSEEVKRVQRRLYALEYLAGTNPADGDFGDSTLQCLKEFQGRNNLPQTGVADEATQQKLFDENAVKSLKPYLLKVSLDDQRVYVYAPDDNEEYTVLVKKFICSTGRNATPTPKGVFKYTAPSTTEWHYFADFGSWAHWPFYIQGDVMFHSVLYNDKDNPKSLQTGTLSKLGTKASHGCVRLKVADAKWIYDNCPRRTTVIIY